MSTAILPMSSVTVKINVAALEKDPWKLVELPDASPDHSYEYGVVPPEPPPSHRHSASSWTVVGPVMVENTAPGQLAARELTLTPSESASTQPMSSVAVKINVAELDKAPR